MPLRLASFSLVLTATAFPQTPHLDRGIVLATTPRHGGVYHVSTGTWTRGDRLASRAGLPDNLYSNTADSGYFSRIVGPNGPGALGTIVDEGVIPSSSNPAPFAFGGSDRDHSTVTEIQLGYCDLDPTPGVAGFRLEFYESYEPCTFPPDPNRLAGAVSLQGAPSNGCWIVDIDLGGAAFDIGHEFNGAHTGLPELDSFGIQWNYIGTGDQDAGLRIAGDPLLTDSNWMVGEPGTSGSNTYFGEVSGCPGSGTGFRNSDFYWIEDTFNVSIIGAGSNCYFFGGYRNLGSPCGGNLRRPFGGYWVELSGDGSSPIVSQPECVGATNATGVPGKIEARGQLDPAANDIELRAFDLPPGEFGVFATALAQVPAMTLGTGNGWICLDPTQFHGIGRFDGALQIKNSGATGEFRLDTAAGEWDVSMIPTSIGTYAAVAGQVSYFQCWHRETNTGTGHNFTDSCSIQWQ